MKVVITGSHGVGKSTIFNLIESNSHFNDFTKIPELAREEIIKRGKRPDQMNAAERFDFEKVLLEKQITMEQQHSKFITDRGILDIIVYSKFLLENPKDLDYIHSRAKDYLKSNPYNKVFYIPVEFPLHIDGVRFEDLEFQKLVDLEVRNTLISLDIEPIYLTGSIESRLNAFINQINHRNPKISINSNLLSDLSISNSIVGPKLVY